MSQPTNPPTKPRRWWRFFVQFSLRSLLIVTTIAAVGCWWFLQPETREEELAGKRLRLRRQVKLLKADPNAPARRPRRGMMMASAGIGGMTGVAGDDISLLNVGRWQLLDEHGDSLVSGRYHEGLPHGWWTVYHTSGRKAAAGNVVRGAREGRWQTWDAEGRLLSEVTYRAVDRPDRYFANEQERAQIAWESHRHGPALTWHPSGQLKLSGHYADDQRHGRWSEYDERGQVVAEGEYRKDLKEGVWKERRTATTGRGLEVLPVEYVGGRTREAHEQLLARLRPDLIGGPLQRQVAAVSRCIELGVHGVPLLREALDQPDDNLKLIALRGLEAIVARAAKPRPGVAVPPADSPVTSDFPSEQLLAKVLPLVAASDERLARPATLIAYRLSPAERERLRAKLIDLVQSSNEPAWQRQALQALFAVEPPRQAETFALLAQVAGPHIPVTPTSFTGLSNPSDRYQFLALTWDLPDLTGLLTTQSQSRDVAVRRFVLAVVNSLAFRGRPTRQMLPGGAVVNQFPVPEPFQELVKQACSDPDPTVKAAAENIGRSPAPPTGMGGGFF
jgi:MORN repeat protein